MHDILATYTLPGICPLCAHEMSFHLQKYSFISCSHLPYLLCFAQPQNQLLSPYDSTTTDTTSKSNTTLQHLQPVNISLVNNQGPLLISLQPAGWSIFVRPGLAWFMAWGVED